MADPVRPLHEELPEGQWWACEQPERRPSTHERHLMHYRPGCHRCWPAFMVAALDHPLDFAVVAQDGVPIKVGVYDLDVTREWWHITDDAARAEFGKAHSRSVRKEAG